MGGVKGQFKRWYIGVPAMQCHAVNQVNGCRCKIGARWDLGTELCLVHLRAQRAGKHVARVGPAWVDFK